MLFFAVVAALPLIQGVGDLADWLPTDVKKAEVMTEEALREWDEGMQQLMAIPAGARTYENSIRAYDACRGQIDLTMQALYVVASVHPDKELRDYLYQEKQKLNQAVLETFVNHSELNAMCQELEGTFSEEEQYYLEMLRRQCRDAGMQLSEGERKELADIELEISDLCASFHRHVSEDTQVLRVNREQLAGLSDAWCAAREEREGVYKLVPDLPTLNAVLGACSVRETREAVYVLYCNRGAEPNEEVVRQLIAKRNRLAKLKGYNDYATMNLSYQMAESPEKVRAFLGQVKEKMAKKVDAEFEQVCAELPEGVVLPAPGQLERFDEEYVFGLYKNRQFALDPVKIAEYFPMEQTLERLLEVYQQFFSLSFQEVAHEIPVPDVKALEVRDGEGQFLGVILLDLFPRPGKISHSGICCPLLPQWNPPEGPRHPASCFVMANFTKPTVDRPSLMTHQEVVTFFHEFGHALHQLLGQSSLIGFCGMNVKWDFVEVPSIVLETWMWDPAILKQVSGHYITGEPLSDTTIKTMIQANRFGLGNRAERLYFLSALSLALFEERGEFAPTQFGQEMWRTERPHIACRDDYHFVTSWWHVPGYGPKYYSYLWSGSFAAELSAKIKEGGLLNPEVGRKYVEAILSKGGTRDPYLLLTDFLGKEPSLEPFLKQFE